MRESRRQRERRGKEREKKKEKAKSISATVVNFNSAFLWQIGSFLAHFKDKVGTYLERRYMLVLLPQKTRAGGSYVSFHFTLQDPQPNFWLSSPSRIHAHILKDSKAGSRLPLPTPLPNNNIGTSA